MMEHTSESQRGDAVTLPDLPDDMVERATDAVMAIVFMSSRTAAERCARKTLEAAGIRTLLGIAQPARILRRNRGLCDPCYEGNCWGSALFFCPCAGACHHYAKAAKDALIAALDRLETCFCDNRQSATTEEVPE